MGTGPNGLVTDFYLGFVIKAGRAAAVAVQTSAFSEPIRLIFTSPPGQGWIIKHVLGDANVGQAVLPTVHAPLANRSQGR